MEWSLLFAIIHYLVCQKTLCLIASTPRFDEIRLDRPMSHLLCPRTNIVHESQVPSEQTAQGLFPLPFWASRSLPQDQSSACTYDSETYFHVPWQDHMAAKHILMSSWHCPIIKVQNASGCSTHPWIYRATDPETSAQNLIPKEEEEPIKSFSTSRHVYSNLSRKPDEYGKRKIIDLMACWALPSWESEGQRTRKLQKILNRQPKP